MRWVRWTLSLLAWPFRQLAEKALTLRMEDMRAEMKLLQVRIEALELERDCLAAIIERDRRRVHAETAEAGARIARTGG